MEIKSTIAIHAKYYAFRLAEGLSAAGVLDKIYTIYPRFKIRDYKIKPEEIKSLWPLGAMKYVGRRLHSRNIENIASEYLDDFTALILRNPGGRWIFTGFSGYSEKSLIRAKKLGAVTLVERACPHIDEQEEIMREEKSLLLKKKISPEKNRVYERMKREYEIADYIVVPSRFSKESFLRKGFLESKLLLTHLSNEKNILFRESKTFPEQFTALCIGGHFYRKGIFYLLKAWEKLALKNAKLIVKTEIPDEFRGLYNIPNTEIIGRHVSDEEINELYGKATIFVLPSVDEGFGMVVVEAMRAALPVIVTENVGAKDIIQEKREGFVIPIRDIDAISERIMFFYKNPEEVKKMGSAALLKSKEYTPKKYSDRVIEVYKKILS